MQNTGKVYEFSLFPLEVNERRLRNGSRLHSGRTI